MYYGIHIEIYSLSGGLNFGLWIFFSTWIIWVRLMYRLSKKETINYVLIYIYIYTYYTYKICVRVLKNGS